MRADPSPGLLSAVFQGKFTEQKKKFCLLEPNEAGAQPWASEGALHGDGGTWVLRGAGSGPRRASCRHCSAPLPSSLLGAAGWRLQLPGWEEGIFLSGVPIVDSAS